MLDSELIIRTRKGDLSAYTELVKRYQGSVLSCLAVRLDHKCEAEDIAQEAFIIAFKKIDEFREEEAFGPWIRTITFNLMRNYWRKHKPTLVGGAAELDILINEEIGLTYSIDNENDQLEALKTCLQKLDNQWRELITLRYYEDIPIRELTKKLDLPHSTITMRLHRIREKLYQCIQKQAVSAE
ncbi:sigma-70 family RNA polymerase sigma factor [Akkermansiaceae bacterium]|nr:sigma-70 family RNA polymerase sigma factor [Akkermansiaceae bacterium]